jgi:dienelactone hydrolase
MLKAKGRMERLIKVIMRSFFVSIVLFAALTAFGCTKKTVLGPMNAVAPATPAANQNIAKTPTPGDITPKTLSIDSAGGVKIAGTFYPASGQSSPAILMLHQWMSDRHSYDDLAKRMQAKGFAVLTIDGRGFGESVKAANGSAIAPSKSDEMVAGMKADVNAAFEFLSKQDNVSPTRIGIVGASYGSSLALICAADNEKVKAVALLSPGVNYFGNMPTEPAVRKYGNRSLLLVAAEDDKESADSVTKLKAAGASERHEVKIYKKGGHGTGLFAAGVGLEDLLEEFFTRSLS